MEQRIINEKNCFVWDDPAEDMIDELALNMMEQNRIDGLLPFRMVYQQGDCCFRYDLDECDSLTSWFENVHGRTEILQLIESIVFAAEEVEQYMMDVGNLCMDETFVTVAYDRCLFAYIPLTDYPPGDIMAFVVHVLNRVKYAKNESCTYIFDMMNAITRGDIKNISELKRWLWMQQTNKNTQTAEPVEEEAEEEDDDEVTVYIEPQKPVQLSKNPKGILPAMPSARRQKGVPPAMPPAREQTEREMPPAMPPAREKKGILPIPPAREQAEREAPAMPPVREKKGIPPVIPSAREKKGAPPLMPPAKEKKGAPPLMPPAREKKGAPNVPELTQEKPAKEKKGGFLFFGGKNKAKKDVEEVSTLSPMPQTFAQDTPETAYAQDDYEPRTVSVHSMDGFSYDDYVDSATYGVQRNVLVRRSTGEEFLLEESQYTIGSGGRRHVDILISGNPAISHVHARITNENGVVKIMDLNSSNGTYVNGEAVRNAEYELEDGMMITLADEEFTFETRGV